MLEILQYLEFGSSTKYA